MTYSSAEIWTIIIIMGVGTFLIRFSFLGLIGDRPMPAFILRLLRYTPVAVLPGMVAPLVLWPAATDGQFDPVRMLAAIATVLIGIWTRNVLWAILGGAATLYALMGITSPSAVRAALIWAAAIDLSSASFSRYSRVCTPGNLAKSSSDAFGNHVDPMLSKPGNSRKMRDVTRAQLALDRA